MKIIEEKSLHEEHNSDKAKFLQSLKQVIFSIGLYSAFSGITKTGNTDFRIMVVVVLPKFVLLLLNPLNILPTMQ
jgi:hypothetical protein